MAKDRGQKGRGTPATKGMGCGSKKARARARHAGYRGGRMRYTERAKLNGGVVA